MKRLRFSISLAALATSIVLAQESGPESQKAAGQGQLAAPAVETAGRQLSPFNKASTLLGSEIKSVDGRPIGKVQDLVLHLERGDLAYTVIALDTPNGKPRQVAVPMRALKVIDGHLILNMSEPVLAAAEGLQEDDWPGTDIFAVGGPVPAETGTASSATESQQE